MLSLSSWLGRRQTPLLGVDVSPAGLRVIELVRGAKGFQVAHYAQESMPSGAMRDGSIVHMDTLTEALRRAVKTSGTRLRSAALALPSGVVIKKMLTLPASLYDEELEMQVEAEASQTLPFPLDEISLDYAVIGPSSSDEAAIDVILVAARKERIDERLALAEGAGLRPLVIEVESQAVTTGLTTTDPLYARRATQPTALLQLGSDGSYCYVILHDQVIFERDLGVSLPRPDQDKSRPTVEPFRETVCQEISRALQLFSTSTQHAGVTRLCVAGIIRPLGEALAIFMQPRLGVEVLVADPFASMSMPSTETQLSHDAPAWLLACGLALRSHAT